MAETPPPTRRNSEIDLDLGFGNVVSSQSRRRLLNRDGTFNVRRTGLGFFESLSVYHFLLEISWPRFLGLAGVWYILANALFAAIYVALGPGALDGVEATSALGSFGEAFFFSVYTFATIGYGNVTPAIWQADVVATLESLAGLLTFGLAAGIMFARFARPNARIIFSRNALIAPYHGGAAFEFRIVNSRKNQIIELSARVILSKRTPDGRSRTYQELSLERQKVAIFPLAWTIVHPIDESSPLWGQTAEDLEQCEAEFLVLLTGFDETFSQTVHARSSYRVHEVRFGARFGDMFDRDARRRRAEGGPGSDPRCGTGVTLRSAGRLGGAARVGRPLRKCRRFRVSQSLGTVLTWIKLPRSRARSFPASDKRAETPWKSIVRTLLR